MGPKTLDQLMVELESAARQEVWDTIDLPGIPRYPEATERQIQAARKALKDFVEERCDKNV